MRSASLVASLLPPGLCRGGTGCAPGEFVEIVPPPARAPSCQSIDRAAKARIHRNQCRKAHGSRPRASLLFPCAALEAGPAHARCNTRWWKYARSAGRAGPRHSPSNARTAPRDRTGRPAAIGWVSRRATNCTRTAWHAVSRTKICCGWGVGGAARRCWRNGARRTPSPRPALYPSSHCRSRPCGCAAAFLADLLCAGAGQTGEILEVQRCCRTEIGALDSAASARFALGGFPMELHVRGSLARRPRARSRSSRKSRCSDDSPLSSAFASRAASSSRRAPSSWPTQAWPGDMKKPAASHFG